MTEGREGKKGREEGKGRTRLGFSLGYNTELPCNVHRCIIVQLSAVHDEVQDKFIFNPGGVSGNGDHLES